MKLVLLSGGSGKRLWPLSNDARSKQFLKVLEGHNETLESMVQRVWGQLESIGLKDSAVIATNKSQVDIMYNQLGSDVPLIIEPCRRDTFPAIALAASYLYSQKDTGLNEVVAILPVDPYVHSSYFNKIKDLESVIQESDADLALIGINPTYPSSKYGYIVPNYKNRKEYIHVDHFIEKPIEEEANKLISKGALWNSGVFAFKLSFIINLMIEKGFPIHYEELLKQYDNLPKISFDYEVVEKTNDIVAVSYDGYWKDLGTWNTLTEEMGVNQIGKGVISKDCKDSHLINELDIPITLLGVPNVVVAASPDGILVANKEETPKIKDIVSEFDNRPMYEERRWGWYRVLDYTKVDKENEVLTKRILVKAGFNLSYQYHSLRSEVWTVIKGEGIFAHNDRLQVVRAGDVLQIKAGDKHALKAVSDFEMIEVQSGTQLIEEDIVRVYMTWDEIEEHCYTINR